MADTTTLDVYPGHSMFIPYDRRMRRNDAASFWRRVDKSGDCWEFQGCRLFEGGYGQIKWSGKNKAVHRVAYELEIGPIPDGMTLDHLCQNTGCVRPSHLEAVTVEENIRRRADRKTKCSNGHPWIPENIRTDNRGQKFCVECRRKTAREYARRKSSGQPSTMADETRCVRGHEWNEANTYVSPKGLRYCRQCRRDRRKQARQ